MRLQSDVAIEATTMEQEAEHHNEAQPASPPLLHEESWQHVHVTRDRRAAQVPDHQRTPGSDLASTEQDSHSGSGTPPLPSLSSPSILSSLGFGTPRREASPSLVSNGEADLSPASRRVRLARRLSRMAKQLLSEDGINEDALEQQVEQIERAMQAKASPPRPEQGPGRAGSPEPTSRQRSERGSLSSSASSSLARSRISDLSALRRREPDLPPEKSDHERPGMTVRQARKVISEVTKLNDDLVTAANNLRARQEESDVSLQPPFTSLPHSLNILTDLTQHIHALLIERAERAAQRIMFLQSRISYV